MDGIGEEDDIGIARGVHPQRGAGESGMSKAADRKYFATRPGEGGVDVPSEAAGCDAGHGLAVWGEDGCAGKRGGWLLGLSHQLERGLLEGKVAGTSGEAVEQGLREEGNIVGGREDSSVACYSTHAARGGVVHGAAEEMAEVGIGRGGAFVVVGCRGGVLNAEGVPETKIGRAAPLDHCMLI
jgi:hypothetical protein